MSILMIGYFLMSAHLKFEIAVAPREALFTGKMVKNILLVVLSMCRHKAEKTHGVVLYYQEWPWSNRVC